jgi:hypothetical protein
MARILEAVLESMKMPPSFSPEASRIKEVPKKITTSTSAHTEVGPSEVIPENRTEENLLEKPSAPALEAPSQDDLDYIVRHASGKQLTEEQIDEVQHYSKDLKYPQGPLVYGGNDKMTSFIVYLTIKKYMSAGK